MYIYTDIYTATYVYIYKLLYTYIYTYTYTYIYIYCISWIHANNRRPRASLSCRQVTSCRNPASRWLFQPRPSWSSSPRWSTTCTTCRQPTAPRAPSSGSRSERASGTCSRHLSPLMFCLVWGWWGSSTQVCGHRYPAPSWSGPPYPSSSPWLSVPWQLGSRWRLSKDCWLGVTLLTEPCWPS